MPNSDSGLTDAKMGGNELEPQITIFNMGDVSLDFHIMTNMDVHRNQTFKITDKSDTYVQNGGAWFSKDLLDEIIKYEEVEVKVKKIVNLVPNPDIIYPDSKLETKFKRDNVAKTYSFVANYQTANRPSPLWRVYQYLGTTDKDLHPDLIEEYKNIIDDYSIGDNDVLIINEYGSHVYNKNNKDFWPDFSNSNPRSVFFRITNLNPEDNDLFKEIYKYYGDNFYNTEENITCNTDPKNKLLLVTTVDDLIKNDIHIRQGLSWEIIAQDIVNSIEIGKLNYLRNVNYLVVIINRSGVLLRTIYSPDTVDYTLFWMNKELLDTNQSRDNGDMRGLNTGLLVNIVKQCLITGNGILDPESIKLGIVKGISCMEKAFQRGFIEKKGSQIKSPKRDEKFKFPRKQIIHSKKKKDDEKYTDETERERIQTTNSINPGEIHIKTEEIMNLEKEIRKYIKAKKEQEHSDNSDNNDNEDNKDKVSGKDHVENKIEPPSFLLRDWSIISSWMDENKITKDNLESLIDIVINGEDHVFKNKVPYARFGNLKVFSKYEIQEFREIKRLIHSYLIKDEHIKPLSIVVFGKPGSGKSFGIKQIVNSFPIRKPEILNFNLSQFAGTQDLVKAFHKIRDEAIMGKHVLAIWDEFDCEFDGSEYGWVKNFLAPMQDGKFFDGSNAHNIGPCIFVFIGSLSDSMAALNKKLEYKKENISDEGENGTSNKTLKGSLPSSSKLPDFITRIHGHLDILGINFDNPSLYPGQEREIQLRRAIMLRSLLLTHCGSIANKSTDDIVLSIEKDLVKDFLTVKEYKHGVRSMESIILMSHIDGSAHFNRSSLPTKEQLSVHVNPEHFIKNI